MGIKIIAKNKRAGFDYLLLEQFEAGLVLLGTEIKGLRHGKVSLNEAWADIDKRGEAWIENMTIGQYSHGNVHNHEEKRKRKLLLNKKEILKIEKAIKTQKLSLIPTKIYLKKSMAKIELFLAKSKKLYDKRQHKAERDAQRQIQKKIYD